MKNGKMTVRTLGVLLAFVLGQVVQLVLHGMVVSLNMWDNRRVIFCGAFGFVILVAVIAGVVIAGEQDEKLKKEFEYEKAYEKYAEVPEDIDEEVNPLAK